MGVRRGDADSLTLIVERHHGPLLGFLYRMTGGDRHMAEDLVQEAFLRVLKAIRGYEYPRPFKPWLYTIATNLARDHYKSADARHTDSDSGSDEPEQIERPHLFADPVATPEDDVLADEEARQVVTALSILPSGQREAVVLRYYQDLSLADIAGALDIPVGTVKSRLSLGLRRLREILEQGAV